MTARRKYPIGIQTFSEIITKDYLYIDKTHLMWQLVNVSKYVFLSRPRRFGKSLLASTLESYYRADKHLFEGLKIMQLETEWQPHPVIHLDLSLAKNQASTQRLEEKLYYLLEPYVKLYGKSPLETTPGSLFHGLITRAFQQSGQQVAVIIDEYDAPLLDTLHASQLLGEFRRVMQDLFQPLKACESKIHSCFITGITKFSQLSIFSTINNISNVTLDPAFATICGITQQEVDDNMSDDVTRLAATYGCSTAEMRGRLQEAYDGYHFSESSPGVYNPFSLMKAFNQQKLGNYWFESGTPTFLLRQMHHYKTDITQLDMQQVSAEAFDQPTEGMRDALPLLYQSGYLTIKGYDREADEYTLGLPNKEVRQGMAKGLLTSYSNLNAEDVRRGFALRFWQALKTDDIHLALTELRSYLAGLPYVEGFKDKLHDVATAEGFYERTFYLILSMLNIYVLTQVKCIRGRIDMLVFMPRTIYVMEIKLNRTAAEALRQIDDRGYALPYATEGRRVVKVGMNFDTATRTLTDWQIIKTTDFSDLSDRK